MVESRLSMLRWVVSSTRNTSVLERLREFTLGERRRPWRRSQESHVHSWPRRLQPSPEGVKLICQQAIQNEQIPLCNLKPRVNPLDAVDLLVRLCLFFSLRRNIGEARSRWVFRCMQTTAHMFSVAKCSLHHFATRNVHSKSNIFSQATVTRTYLIFLVSGSSRFTKANGKT